MLPLWAEILICVIASAVSVLCSLATVRIIERRQRAREALKFQRRVTITPERESARDKLHSRSNSHHSRVSTAKMSRRRTYRNS